MEDQIAQLQRTNKRQEDDLAETGRKHQSEIDRLKNEINQLNDKHLAELEDEKESYQKVNINKF